MAVSRGKNAAFTLVELLVVITIIGMLMGLLMPAVGMVREAMRRTQCKNNLAQLGRAAQSHLTAQGHFPTGGWGYMWLGDPDCGYSARQPGGWIYNSLPYMGFNGIHDIGKGTGTPGGIKNDPFQTSGGTYQGELKAAVVEVLYCPTRRRAIGYPSNQTSYNSPEPSTIPSLVGRTDYAGNGGSNILYGAGPNLSDNCFLNFTNCPSWSTADSVLTNPSSGCNGVFGERSEVSQIPDGQSTVLLAGEKYLNPNDYNTGADPGDNNSALQGNGPGVIRWGATSSSIAGAALPLRDAKSTVQQYSFGSAHAAGFNVVFCDGHAQLMSFSVSGITFQQLAVRNDGNPPDSSY